jgi:hypothetical protein
MAAADNPAVSYPLHIFLVTFMSKHGMVDENRFARRDVHTRICEERMGPDPSFKALSGDSAVASKIRWGSGSSERWFVAADNLRLTYAIVIPSSIGMKDVEKRVLLWLL